MRDKVYALEDGEIDEAACDVCALAWFELRTWQEKMDGFDDEIAREVEAYQNENCKEVRERVLKETGLLKAMNGSIRMGVSWIIALAPIGALMV